GGKIVVYRLGEDLRAPTRRPQGVAQLQRVGRRGVVRVEGGDELVHGHRPPGGSAHRSAGAYGEVMASRTAMTRKSRPSGPDSATASYPLCSRRLHQASGRNGRPAARSASGGASAASQACRVTEWMTSVPPGASRVPMVVSSWLR